MTNQLGNIVSVLCILFELKQWRLTIELYYYFISLFIYLFLKKKIKKNNKNNFSTVWNTKNKQK
jgi:hypothetical protein